MFPITIPFIPLVESHLHRCGMHCHVHACIQKRVRTAECRMEHSMVLHLQHTCHARYSFGIAHLVHEVFDSGSVEVNDIICGTVLQPQWLYRSCRTSPSSQGSRGKCHPRGSALQPPSENDQQSVPKSCGHSLHHHASQSSPRCGRGTR